MTDEQPTNQFPPPPPGAYLPEAQAPGEPVPARRPRRGLITAVVAVVVVLGAGIGVAVAVGADGDDTLPLGAPSSTTAGSPGAASSGAIAGKKGGKKGGKAGANGNNTVIRGTILTESGSTWTVKTRQGKTATVTVGTATQFGTKKAPAKAADFPVGHQVAIAGSPAAGSGGTFVARRVRTPVAKGQGQGKAGGSATSTPTPTPSPSSS